MTQRDWLSNLDAETRAALTARSDLAGLGRLALHLGALGFSTAVILSGLPFWWLALPVQGLLLVFLFCLQHEATHQTPFASPGLNEAVGRLLAVPLIQPFLWFRYFHLAHHRWTNLPGQDPELEGPEIATRADWFRHVSGLPLWRAALRTELRLAVGRVDDPFVPPGARAAVVREARMLLVVHGLLALSLLWSSAAFWLWILPALIGQPALRLYLLAEHGDCPRVADMLANTRTTLTHPLIRLLAWNMPYHTEHHVWPQVPFHRLPQVHALLRDRLVNTSEGYRAFSRDYLARRGLLQAGAAAARPEPDRGGGR